MEPLKAIDPLATDSNAGCDSWRQFRRRRWIQGAAGLVGGLLSQGVLTRVAERLATAAESKGSDRLAAKSLIILWMQGGPSQLETFDPHEGSKIGGETKAIDTSAKGIRIANTLPRTSEVMHHATLIRSMVSREGDHERATYNMKTGWRPDPTLAHPTIGAVICHQSENNIEIPRHVSILSGQWPARGGYMGNEFDAFQLDDPKNPLPNLKSYTDPKVFENRLRNLSEVVESEFRRGRIRDLDRAKTLHETSTQRATTMMASQQIKAFDVSLEPLTVLQSFGNTAFGRGCLAAVRLVENGVRCVEVELSGWDSHVENHSIQSNQCEILDSALHAILEQLSGRGLLDSTVLMCGGEFGRTPQINVAGGRDHWPTGFSTLLAGGPFRRGHAHGLTTSESMDRGVDPLTGIEQAVRIEDLHATLLHSFGIDFSKELQTPIGRPLALSQGKIIESLLRS
jgi:hypothetical protein